MDKKSIVKAGQDIRAENKSHDPNFALTFILVRT